MLSLRKSQNNCEVERAFVQKFKPVSRLEKQESFDIGSLPGAWAMPRSPIKTLSALQCRHLYIDDDAASWILP